MGMDLIGLRLSYNWTGWKWLVDHLRKWGVDVSELKFMNDGDPISRETCLSIADAIEAHFDELTSDEQQWLEGHIDLWRKCNGCFQW